MVDTTQGLSTYISTHLPGAGHLLLTALLEFAFRLPHRQTPHHERCFPHLPIEDDLFFETPLVHEKPYRACLAVADKYIRFHIRSYTSLRLIGSDFATCVALVRVYPTPRILAIRSESKVCSIHVLPTRSIFWELGISLLFW